MQSNLMGLEMGLVDIGWCFHLALILILAYSLQFPSWVPTIKIFIRDKNQQALEVHGILGLQYIKRWANTHLFI